MKVLFCKDKTKIRKLNHAFRFFCNYFVLIENLVPFNVRKEMGNITFPTFRMLHRMPCMELICIFGVVMLPKFHHLKRPS